MKRTVENLLNEYEALQLHDIIDYNKFNEFSITHHSTRIEGSTLTENETRLLLDEGLTPNNRPLIHSLMVIDHFNALKFIIENIKTNSPIHVGFIQQINAHVMKQTGGAYNTPLGNVDASKGEYRKGNVSAGGHYFPSYDKVEAYLADFVKKLNDNLAKFTLKQDRLLISFAAHFDLVSIHPFYDGNGRTSRLLMNYIQLQNNLPLAIVFSEDKTDYYNAIDNSRKENSIQPFEDFMLAQYAKYLELEINKFKDKEKLITKTGSGFSIFF